MKSELTEDFIKIFQQLPERIKRNARKKYKLWRNDQSHPSLEFKRLKTESAIYSIRISLGYRALGVLNDKETIIWFWAGSHTDYERLINYL